MEKGYYIHKIINFWDSLWSKVSWKEIFIICILIVIIMTYIKVNIATYKVQCNDGSIVLIHHGVNYVCDSELFFNSWTGRATEKIETIGFNKQDAFNEYLKENIKFNLTT